MMTNFLPPISNSPTSQATQRLKICLNSLVLLLTFAVFVALFDKSIHKLLICHAHRDKHGFAFIIARLAVKNVRFIKHELPFLIARLKILPAVLIKIKIIIDEFIGGVVFIHISMSKIIDFKAYGKVCALKINARFLVDTIATHHICIGFVW